MPSSRRRTLLPPLPPHYYGNRVAPEPRPQQQQQQQQTRNAVPTTIPMGFPVQQQPHPPLQNAVPGMPVTAIAIDKHEQRTDPQMLSRLRQESGDSTILKATSRYLISDVLVPGRAADDWLCIGLTSSVLCGAQNMDIPVLAYIPALAVHGAYKAANLVAGGAKSMLRVHNQCLEEHEAVNVLDMVMRLSPWHRSYVGFVAPVRTGERGADIPYNGEMTRGHTRIWKCLTDGAPARRTVPYEYTYHLCWSSQVECFYLVSSHVEYKQSSATLVVSWNWVDAHYMHDCNGFVPNGPTQGTPMFWHDITDPITRTEAARSRRPIVLSRAPRRTTGPAAPAPAPAPEWGDIPVIHAYTHPAPGTSRGGSAASSAARKSTPQNRWVRTDQKVRAHAHRRLRTVYRNVKTGELRVRKAVTRGDGDRRYVYVKF